MKKLLRFLLHLVLTLLITVILIAFFTLAPVDRTPLKEKEFYVEMMQRLDSLNEHIADPAYGKFQVGFAKENLVPSFPVATAGYGNRRGRNYTSIRDSIFVRAVVIGNGSERIAIVSAELLIIPPLVTQILEKKLPGVGFSLENTYLNATHTHNSIGNWAEGATEFVYGDYDDSVVQFIADQIIKCVSKASRQLVEGSIRTGRIDIPSGVRHRITKLGTVDPSCRVMEIDRNDGIKIAIVSYNAHPTCLFSKDLSLSGDYPGKLVADLERDAYDFAVFLSGAVGSHGCSPPEYGDPCIDWMAQEISSNVVSHGESFQPLKDSALMMIRLPLEIGEPQLKIARDWRLRSWVFTSLVGENRPYLTGLRIGNLIMLGTPCDYSGELSASIDSVASAKGFETIITSFNGQYIGYITKDDYYDSAHYETRFMNWYGPGNGTYVTESLEKLLSALADSHR